MFFSCYLSNLLDSLLGVLGLTLAKRFAGNDALNHLSDCELSSASKTAASASSDRRQCGPGHRHTAPFYTLTTNEGASFGQLRATSKPLMTTTHEADRPGRLQLNDGHISASTLGVWTVGCPWQPISSCDTSSATKNTILGRSSARVVATNRNRVIASTDRFIFISLTVRSHSDARSPNPSRPFRARWRSFCISSQTARPRPWS